VRQGATAHSVGTTSDQCFFAALSHVELLVLENDPLKVVLIVEDEFVFTLSYPEERWLPTLPDVIPRIFSIGANAVIARYGVNCLLGVFFIAHHVTARSFSRNPLEVVRLETPRHAASSDFAQDLVM
jgi:hypothetical protein